MWLRVHCLVISFIISIILIVSQSAFAVEDRWHKYRIFTLSFSAASALSVFTYLLSRGILNRSHRKPTPVVLEEKSTLDVYVFPGETFSGKITIDLLRKEIMV